MFFGKARTASFARRFHPDPFEVAVALFGVFFVVALSFLYQ
jgi:hypothetical protein